MIRNTIIITIITTAALLIGGGQQPEASATPHRGAPHSCGRLDKGALCFREPTGAEGICCELPGVPGTICVAPDKCPHGPSHPAAGGDHDDGTSNK